MVGSLTLCFISLAIPVLNCQERAIDCHNLPCGVWLANVAPIVFARLDFDHGEHRILEDRFYHCGVGFGRTRRIRVLRGT
jgi:hypothetical protein